MSETREEYAARMRKCVQFRHFGIDPIWKPGEQDIDGFCHDEVVRQFHDTRIATDGGVRVKWMRSAWGYAENQALVKLRDPGYEDVLTLGALVELQENANGFRLVNVYIGNRMGAPPGYLPELVRILTDPDILAQAVPDLGRGNSSIPYDLSLEDFENDCKRLIKNADDWYLAYEWVHPFGDGNGRSGKILHNWLNGTLDDPVLVRDYFGGGNP